MSCFHLLWLENAGWTGALLGAGAAFWEPRKFFMQRRSATRRIKSKYKYSVNKYKYWKPGKFVADEERNLEN